MMLRQAFAALILTAAIGAVLFDGQSAKADTAVLNQSNLANCLRAEGQVIEASDVCADIRAALISIERGRTPEMVRHAHEARLFEPANHVPLPLSAPARKMSTEYVESVRSVAALPLARPTSGCVRDPDFLIRDRARIEKGGLLFSDMSAVDRKSGIAVAVPAGCLIHSPIGGEIVFAKKFSGYGDTVIVKRGKEDYLIIAGLSDLRVERGERIAKGTPLGLTVRQNASALHEAFRPGKNVVLYFEVRSAAGSTDPLVWLAALS